MIYQIVQPVFVLKRPRPGNHQTASCLLAPRESHPWALARTPRPRATLLTLLLPVGMSIIVPATGQSLPGATRFTRKGVSLALFALAFNAIAPSTLRDSKQKLLCGNVPDGCICGSQ